MARDLRTGVKDEQPTSRRRSWWGWGWADQAMTTEQCESLAGAAQDRFGRALEVREPVRLEDVELRAPRIRPPDALAHLCSTDVSERAGHTYGKSYRDVVRGFRGQFTNPPDVVARPTTEADVVALLDWCGTAASRPCPTAADRRWSVASNVSSATSTPVRCRST